MCGRCDYLGFASDLDYNDAEMRAYVDADRAQRAAPVSETVRKVWPDPVTRMLALEDPLPPTTTNIRAAKVTRVTPQPVEVQRVPLTAIEILDKAASVGGLFDDLALNYQSDSILKFAEALGIKPTGTEGGAS